MTLPFFCGSSANDSTRPTTSGPLSPSAADSTRSTSSPTRTRAAPSCWAERPAGNWAYSATHDTGARMSGLHAERLAEAHVTLDDVAHVCRTVAEHHGALDSHAERETAVHVRIDPARAQHARIHHAAAAPLDPAL